MCVADEYAHWTLDQAAGNQLSAGEKNEVHRVYINVNKVLICFSTRLRQLLVRELFGLSVARCRRAAAAGQVRAGVWGPGLLGVPAAPPGQCLTIVRYPVLICYRYLPVFMIGRIFFMLIFRTSRQGSIAELTESRPNRCILT